MEAVSAWLIRRAEANAGRLAIGTDGSFILLIPFELVSITDRNDAKIYFLSALHIERNVNCSESRGTLSTKGRTAQPSPVGIERDSETDSTCM